MQNTPLVSIVILNWNGEKDTLHCLQSLRHTSYSNFEIIVVDNGSTHQFKAPDIFQDKKIHVIRNRKNLGFTGGEISALSSCHGEYILLLNNDATLSDHSLEMAVKTIVSDPKIAVVGGKSYLVDDDWDPVGSHAYTYQGVDPVTAEVETYMRDDGKTEDVSNVSGACVLIRRKAIDEVGYFDNRFFAYYEETDLFARFRRASWRIVYNPEVIIWHKHGASTKDKKYMYYYYMLKNQYLFAYKNFDKKYLRAYKKCAKRHFMRSLKIYLKHAGRLEKHDFIHKARVISYIKNVTIYRPFICISRVKTLSKNRSFSLNDHLFNDRPLRMSLYIDATDSKDFSVLQHNVEVLKSLKARPAEIIVVSKKPIPLPKGDSKIRIENIHDKGSFEISPLSFFFMTSNNDVLVFGSKSLISQKITDESALADTLKHYYFLMESGELSAITSGGSDQTLTRRAFMHEDFSLLTMRKVRITHFLTDNSLVNDISLDTLTTVLGETIAHCLPSLQTTARSPFIGLPKGSADLVGRGILAKPFRWNVKNILVKTHLLIFLNKLRSLVSRSSIKDTTGSVHSSLHYSSSIPIIINVRDRYDPLIKLIDFMRSLGHNRILLVDNDSTNPQLLHLFEDSDIQVIRLGRNGMHKAPWESMAVRFAAKDMPYIVSDPDIIFDNSTPKDLIKALVKLLDTYQSINKAGVALRINDLPDHFSQKASVIAWESRFWAKELELEKNVYAADVDTTFALYRPHTWWFLSPSLRLAGRYSAIHEPWYQNSLSPTTDFIYYTARASRNVSTWGLGKLPKHHLTALKKEGILNVPEKGSK